VYQLAILCFWLQANFRSTSSYEINPNYNICKNYIIDFLSDTVISHLQTFQDQHLCHIVSCCIETLTHLRTRVSLITLYKVWKVFTFSSDHRYSTFLNYFNIEIQFCGYWHTIRITLILHLILSNILQQRHKCKLMITVIWNITPCQLICYWHFTGLLSPSSRQLKNKLLGLQPVPPEAYSSTTLKTGDIKPL
jgi:hypothetical protein